MRRPMVALAGLAWLGLSSVACADGLMLIQAGAFWMGRDGGPPEEAPLHRVFVTDFWIERHQVTRAEFAEFLAVHGRASPDGTGRVERRPVAGVSWFDARDYCRWKGRRLPTEAEWEKVARDASAYGVEDMLGNLREWTSTGLQPYPYRKDDGRQEWSGRERVVVRGASHDDPAEDLSATRRRSYDRRGAAAGHPAVGFRCATSEDLGGY